MPNFKDCVKVKGSNVVDTAGSLHQAGVKILSSAAELNLVDGADRVQKTVRVALGVADTAGGVLSWANPETSDIIITSLVVDVTTKSTAACTVDFGTTAVSATTTSDTLIDGVDTGTAVITADNNTDKGTNGKTRQRLASGKWVTGSKSTGAAAGTVGFAYITYIVV